MGSLFYREPLNTEGAFTRGGALFFSILFLGWLQLSELMKAVSGRAVVARHRDYAFYRPSAVSVARVVTDFPVIFIQVCIFSVIMYFLCSLDVQASKFWIYLLFVYTMTMCMTALYRMFAALSPTIDDAVRFSGIALNLLIIYTGYVIPKTQLVSKYVWFGWIYYINPISYAFESVLTNEFSDREMTCAESMLVPQGPGVNPSFQGCAISGASVNTLSVSGAAYLDAQFTYTRSHLWRNFGVLVAWAVLYILVTVVAVETFNFARSGGGALVFKKTKKAKRALKKASGSADEEKAVSSGPGASSESSSGVLATSSPNEGGEERTTLEQISKSESIFTWQDVDYSVPYQGGQRKLLDKVSGYAKPGVMVALMGASGAGKTTLLNTLAQRQRIGVVSGEMKVDGQELGLEFQRGTGFCEQMDLHDGTATIREALEFSALLRQDHNTPRTEKLAYVDRIIDLLELRELQDAIIFSLGVEQRKRLTIGVELAAKPQLLLFLDEPTSGLDSQSAWSIVSFLKKLARAGQAIVCTIHQPSSEIIQASTLGHLPPFTELLASKFPGIWKYCSPHASKLQGRHIYCATRGRPSCIMILFVLWISVLIISAIEYLLTGNDLGVRHDFGLEPRRKDILLRSSRGQWGRRHQVFRQPRCTVSSAQERSRIHPRNRCQEIQKRGWKEDRLE